ncbi:MAG: IclR family transcriptional regulator [Haloarculaceae archaeon]
MESRDPQGTTVKAVERAMTVIEAVREADGGRVTALAEELGLAKSTVHGYLSTLHELGYLTKEDDVYYVGAKFLRLGEYSRTRRPEYVMAAEKVTELAAATDERAQFVIEEHGRGAFLYRESGSHAVETDSEAGKRMYLHTTSAGKCILAHLPDERVEAIIDRWGLPAMTPNTITDREAMVEELAAIRERGYAYNRAENIEGLHAVGVPLTTRQHGVVGALSISGPSHRMKGDWFERELPDRLLGTANELELNIAYA